MKAEVYAAHSQLSVDGAEITADSVKCKFLGNEEKAHTIQGKNESIGGERGVCARTLRRFEVLERRVEDYIATKYNRTDLM